ncbi:MAG: hypothetical protein M0Z95_05545 [Actinomycetota bacterium]|jgi:hypothetical protein|nr:hypothetical protein [Actinomycetota bacterium]
MVELLRIVLGALVVASLAAIVVYVVAFVAVAAWTVLTSHWCDPLADELDRVLAEIVGPQVLTASAVKHDGGLVGVPRRERAGALPGPFGSRRSS